MNAAANTPVSNGPSTSAAHDTDQVLYAVEDGIATITLNRPDRQNTITRPMLAAFSKCLVQANADPEVRVVIVTGAGRFFCAGLDLRGGSGIGEGKHGPTLDLREAPPTVLHHMDKPTLCALNGSSAGYGMDMALGCDIRVMAEGSKMAAAFTARGVVPESGGTWLLPRMLGWARAAELIFTGRTLDAAQCLEMGLVSHVVPADQVMSYTRALAREIASNAPLAVQAAKRMMRMSANENFSDHVHHVYLQLLPLFQSDDFREGMAAFMEKRPAQFKGQ
ncbi:MAG: enoyl-CoA hydratase/isomerase family protein [Burkholderiales bacterium]|jgi:enoyl-CoA hydratase/carnithine racemase